MDPPVIVGLAAVGRLVGMADSLPVWLLDPN